MKAKKKFSKIEADRLDIRHVGIEPDLQWFYSDAVIAMLAENDYSPIDVRI